MLSWGAGRSVESYVSQGKYDKAIELLEEQLQRNGKNVRLRLEDITARYPGVRKVIQAFHDRRAGSVSELSARTGR